MALKRFIFGLVFLSIISSYWTIPHQACSEEKTVAPQSDRWSKPVGGVSARLRVAYIEDGFVHLEGIGAVPLVGNMGHRRAAMSSAGKFWSSVAARWSILSFFR